MKFKVVGKSLILTDYSHKITEGENSFDTVEIAVPRYHDDCDLSALSFRFSETSEDGENSAVQVLHHTKCDEKYIYLKGTITSDFSSFTGKVIFMLTGVNGENVVAKFQSAPYTISDDISLTSLPNETTAEQLFNQTQLEVQKAIDAADRAEIASQTPAPAEIYPATTERLGGVKVDGKTITVTADGTVSAADSENLKNEIADIRSSQTSMSGIAVQIAHPNNFLIYDNAGKPSVMVAIPKFYLDEVIDGASHTVHPAFIVNGVVQDAIYISKYQNIVEDGRAYSMPMKDPAVNVNFDQAYEYCKAKGKGWHLMTNAEWAAIALWCKKNGTLPKGNNNCGKDTSESLQKAFPQYYNPSNINQIWRTSTGSGPMSWYHDSTESGIADLNGNVWEWISGARLNNGEINIIENNNAADTAADVGSENTQWKAILTDGSLVTPDTNGTVKYNISRGTKAFGDVSTTSNITETAAAALESLALLPHNNSSSADYGDDVIWVDSNGEKPLLRGGDWNTGAYAGIFSLQFYSLTRQSSGVYIGFRSAFCDL